MPSKSRILALNWPWPWAAVVVVILTASGCSSGKRVAAENDRLRAEAIDLTVKVTELENRNQELVAQLKLASAGEPQPSADPEVLANTPVVTSLKLGKLSHVIDENQDGTPEKLILYVEPFDGRGRFTQMVGSIAVTAAMLPIEGASVTIGQGRFTPTQVRDAYRSSMMGTHYTFEVPIQVTLPPAEKGKPAPTATVRVELSDGLTGQTLAGEKTIALR